MFNHMVEQLDRVFSALSDPTRRAMLRRLTVGERMVGELAEPFDMSFAAAAKHVKVLEEAGLLSRTIDGRSHRCRLSAGRSSRRTSTGRRNDGTRSAAAIRRARGASPASGTPSWMGLGSIAGDAPRDSGSATRS